MSFRPNSSGRFADLVQTHTRALSRYAYWLSGNGDHAEELVQDTMLRAWSAFGNLRDDSSAKAWLFKILKNEFLRRITSRKRHNPISLELVAETDLAEDDEMLATFELRDALHKLPQDYREPLMLQVADGMNLQEIGELLNLPANTVASRVFRARAMLLAMTAHENPPKQRQGVSK